MSDDPLEKPKRGRPPGQRPAKRRVSTYLSTELYERALNAAFWTAGASVAQMITRGLRAEIERREKINGGPFPQRLEGEEDESD